MPKKGDKTQQSMMTTPVEELMRMLVEERAQRDTEFTRRERGANANGYHAAAHRIALTSSV